MCHVSRKQLECAQRFELSSGNPISPRVHCDSLASGVTSGRDCRKQCVTGQVHFKVTLWPWHLTLWPEHQYGSWEGHVEAAYNVSWKYMDTFFSYHPEIICDGPDELQSDPVTLTFDLVTCKSIRFLRMPCRRCAPRFCENICITLSYGPEAKNLQAMRCCDLDHWPCDLKINNRLLENVM